MYSCAETEKRGREKEGKRELVGRKDQIVLDMIWFVVMSQNNFIKFIKMHWVIKKIYIQHNLLEFLL